MRVAVVGAGIIGMTTAVAIKEAFPTTEVTIFVDNFTPYTTGSGCADLWSPYIFTDTEPEKTLRWYGCTHKWMESLWKSELAANLGISLIPVYQVTSDVRGHPRPVWASTVLGGQVLTADELSRLNKLHKTNYSGGWHSLSYTCEPRRLIPYLMERFASMNGLVVQRKIVDLRDLRVLGQEGYDIVSNCTGLGSAALLCDNSVFPVRDQVARIRTPCLSEYVLQDNDPGNYVIPNVGSVVLGGANAENNRCSLVRPKDSSIFIRGGCERSYTSIKNCKSFKEWGGHRSCRDKVRLESEVIRITDGSDLLVIHNYGHGGSGLTLCWGCASDVVEIIRHHGDGKVLCKL